MRIIVKRVFALAVVALVVVMPFLAGFDLPSAKALSTETTGLYLTSVDNTQGKSCYLGGFFIYVTDRKVLFYEDDLTVKTFDLECETTVTSTNYSTNIINYNSTHILVATSFGWEASSGQHNDYQWLDYWLINVNSLAYSRIEVELYSIMWGSGTQAYGDLVLLTLDGAFYAIVGGKWPYNHAFIVKIYPTYVTTTTINGADNYLYGSSLWIPHASDPDIAYIISRNSHTGTRYRIFKFDADVPSLTLIATSSNDNTYSDFAFYYGYLIHTLYGNLYYDILFAYNHLTTTETLYLQFSRFNDTYLDETRVTLEPSSSVDKLRPFSILAPVGVTGEDDLADGYYSVVFVGNTYNIQQIVVALTGVNTLTPELDIVSGQFTYQSKTHYYTASSNIGGWQPTAWTIGIYYDYTNGKAIADTFVANEEPTPPASYSAEVTSNPAEIFATFWIDEDAYETPETVPDLIGTYTFTAEHALINESQGYLFDHWLINGADEYTSEAIIVSIYDDITLEMFYEEVTLVYANVTSNPEIGAYFYMDSNYYTTPEDVLNVPDNYTFTAQASKVVGEIGYVFENWQINGTTNYYTTTIELNITEGTTLIINYTEGPVYHCGFSSNPEIASAFWVDTDAYNTPETVVVTEGSHTFTSESAKIVSGTAYQFDYWRINSTTNYYTTAISLSITGNTTLTIYFEEVESLYTIYGVYNETTGLWMKTNCTVTVYFAVAQPNHQFTLNGSYNYVPDYDVRYFHFELGDYDREYWVNPTEDTATIYVFNDTLTGYIINFMDHAGILKTNQYVEAKFHVNGTLFIVDKRKVDVQNSIAMSLKNTRKYQLVISGTVTYIYGDLLMTDQTSVQLVLRGIDFPKETLLIYAYVRVYGVRDFAMPTGSVTTWFQDTTENTNNVTVTIAYKNGTTAFTATETSQYFSLTWPSAVNSSDYRLAVTIDHETYGTYDYRQYFVGQFGVATPPFSLAWLGASFPFDSSIILPSLLLIFVAACFSVLNAEVGAILTVIIAIILVALGWLAIGTGALVTAFALSILMALAYAKRRIIT